MLKEASRNRGRAESEEEQRSVIDRNNRKENLFSLHKVTPGKSGMTEHSWLCHGADADVPTECSWHETELCWTASLKSPQTLCQGLGSADLTSCPPWHLACKRNKGHVALPAPALRLAMEMPLSEQPAPA